MNNNYFRRLITVILTVILFAVGIVPFVSSTLVQSQTNYENQYAPLTIDWWPKFHHDANQIGFSTSTAPETDDVLWEFQTDGYITSSPAVIDGKVYVGSWDRKLYCLDMMNGEELWNFTAYGKISGSPAVDDGKVYFGSWDRKLYCLDMMNGEELWNFTAYGKISGSPAVDDGKVLFGTSGGSSYGLLYCLNTNDGSFIWSYPTGNVISSSPAVTNNKVYFGSLNGIFYCLNVSTGDFIWSNTTAGGIGSSPTVYNGKVYFGSNDNFLYCLDADDGGFIWNYNTDGEVQSSPAIAYDYVYIGSSSYISDQGLYCVDAETGELVWEYLIDGGVWTPPSVADGKVFYGTDFCCGAPGYVYCNDAYTGERIWKYNTGGEEGAMKSSPAIAAGKVFVGASSGLVFAFGGNELYADAHGPYIGVEDTPIQFIGDAYGGKPEYEWHWDFGNGDSSNEQNPIYTYEDGGNYLVTLTVTDEFNDEAIDETTAIMEEINDPPNKPVIDGPLNGKIGEEYEYIFSAVDLDGDDVYYFIEWDDGDVEEWIGPYSSGEKVKVNHSWDEKDDYIISCKAKDIYDEESDWAYLEVTMPKNKAFNFNFPLISWLLEFIWN